MSVSRAYTPAQKVRYFLFLSRGTGCPGFFSLRVFPFFHALFIALLLLIPLLPTFFLRRRVASEILEFFSCSEINWTLARKRERL